MKGDYFVLALKNLKHRGIRSWLTLLGIVIGVTAVVSLISLGNALQMAVGAQFGVSSMEMITVQAGGISGVGPPGTGVVKKLTLQDSDAIEKLSTVEFTIPRNIETVRFEYNDILQVGFIGSIPDGEKRKFTYNLLEIEVESGRLLSDSDSHGVVLGNDFMFEDKGGFEKEISIGENVLINGRSFKVVGILEKQGSFIWDSVILMNENVLKDLANYENEVDLIAVKVKDKDLMEKAKEEIEKLLRKRRDVKVGEEDFEVSTPTASLSTINSVRAVQAFVVVIAFISIIVGAIGIVNTMTTSVLERKKEIGVMKSIGARNGQIFMQFFVESGLLGFVGGLLGIIFGTLLGFAGTGAINSFIGGDIRPNLDFMLMGITLFGSFFIGALAGIIPAMRAASQDPVEALRG